MTPVPSQASIVHLPSGRYGLTRCGLRVLDVETTSVNAIQARAGRPLPNGARICKTCRRLQARRLP